MSHIKSKIGIMISEIIILICLCIERMILT